MAGVGYESAKKLLSSHPPNPSENFTALPVRLAAFVSIQLEYNRDSFWHGVCFGRIVV